MAEVKYVERDNETSVSLLTANWSAQIKPKILNTRTQRENLQEFSNVVSLHLQLIFTTVEAAMTCKMFI